MNTELKPLLQQMQALLSQMATLMESGSSVEVRGLTKSLATDNRANRVYYAPPSTYRVRDGVTLAIDGEKPHWISNQWTGAVVLRLCDGHIRWAILSSASQISIMHQRNHYFGREPDLTYLETFSGMDYVSKSPRCYTAYRGRAEATELGQACPTYYLFVTNDCNLRCTHCYVSSGDYVPPREMTTEEIYGVIDQARELGVARFLVTGGEPFMVRDIYDIVRYITAESDLVLLTNAMFLSEKNLDRLEKSKGRGSISLQVSLDGPLPNCITQFVERVHLNELLV